MKKFLKFLGGVAVAATVIPFSYKKNEENGEKTIQALLWKASIQPDPEMDSKQKLSLSLGFNNPFQSEAAMEEADLFANDVTVDYTPVCECECTDECAEVNECCCESAVEEIVEEVAEGAAEAAEEVVEAVEEVAEEVTAAVEEIASPSQENTAE